MFEFSILMEYFDIKKYNLWQLEEATEEENLTVQI